VIREAARDLWAEPRAPNPPKRVWRDWVLVAAIVPSAVLEGVLRDHLVWRGVSIAVVVALAPTLLWRRTHPLAAVTIAFGTLAILDVVSLLVGVEWDGLGTGAFLLLLVYALVRWGSGREVALGMAVVLVPVVLTVFHDTPTGDLIGGAVVVLLFAAVGAAVRYQHNARLRGIDQVKLREREQLARELHDTVAHHVSAIAVRAQAGRTVASPSTPQAALDALAVIEDEASRTLEELRAIVGALRQGEEPDRTPQRGVADIQRLANSRDGRQHIIVELSGDLDRLRPSADAALYRLAQESITNALRHARHATRIRVCVRGERDCVRLTVSDDGDTGPPGSPPSSGFGLVGMAERAKLLGGTLEAGPNRDRGWTVHAVLPRAGGGS
jgi:signal transduction histidine kinase